MTTMERAGITGRYTVVEDGRTRGMLALPKRTSDGSLTLDGAELTIRAASFGRSYELVDAEGAMIARAQRDGSKVWTIESGAQSCTVRRTERRAWQVEPALGVVRSERWRSGASAELPGLGLPVRALVMALVLVEVRRRRLAASAAVSAASG